MNSRTISVLIHSPLVGGLTWRLVADQIRQRGLEALVPALNDTPHSEKPFWKQHAESVSKAFADIPPDIPIIWIAHSGAGPLLPAIRQSIPNPVHTYVFVDAGIPQHDATRLDLMRLEDAEWANEFQQELEQGRQFPAWSFDDLQEIIPDESLRAEMVSELRPRGLDFFTEPIPVFDGWPDAPCIYIQFSESYDWDAAQTRQFGWPTYKVEAGHFHMLVQPKEVTQLMIEAVNNLHSAARLWRI
jgi:hypothetical protein